MTRKEFIKAFKSVYKDVTVPDGFVLKNKSHSTADEIAIYVEAKGVLIEVYFDRLWCSAVYEFNDRGLTFGIQPGFEFLSPYIENIQKDICNLYQEKLLKQKQKEEQEELEKQDRLFEQIAAVKQRLGVKDQCDEDTIEPGDLDLTEELKKEIVWSPDILERKRLEKR